MQNYNCGMNLARFYNNNFNVDTQRWFELSNNYDHSLEYISKSLISEGFVEVDDINNYGDVIVYRRNKQSDYGIAICLDSNKYQVYVGYPTVVNQAFLQNIYKHFRYQFNK